MITKFNLFEAYDPNIKVTLRSGSVTIDMLKWEITNLNNIVSRYIESVYEPYGYIYLSNKIIDVDGRAIDTEFIDKMINNIKIYSNIVKSNNLKTKDEFINFVKNNLFDIYHFDGIYFDKNMEILDGTIKKGKRGESKSLEYLANTLISKGVTNFEIKTPDKYQDNKGYDGYLIYKGKTRTIQVKPFSTCEINNDKINITSDGSLTFGTNYLVLYKEKTKKDEKIYEFIILDNIKGEKIVVDGNLYICKSENIVSTNSEDLNEIILLIKYGTKNYNL